jgi:hypothetical protein
MDTSWWWLIGIVGPMGVMALARVIGEAYADWKNAREPQLALAAWDEVEAVEEILIELLPKLFDVRYEECFISNDSDLTHFTTTDEQSERVRALLLTEYGVDVAVLADERLVTVANAIRERRRA